MISPLALFLIVLTGTCAGSLLPARWLPQWLPNDKVLHVGFYFALTMLALAEFNLAGWGALAVLLVFAVGLILEFVQNHVPGRGFSMGDIASNTFGIMAGVAIHALLA